MKILFWYYFGLICYTYFGYPLILGLLAKLNLRPVRKGAKAKASVSVLISVCDEQDVIEKKIKNILSLDYPVDKLEILIGSDGSKDRSHDIVRGFNEPRLRFVEFNRRRGKISVLNDLVPQAKGVIIVFNDARQMLAKDAIQELVANFADPAVGAVSGELIFVKDKALTGRGIQLYWDYEKMIRHCEGLVHSTIGATGAIYAIRKELYVPAPAQVILDDVYQPLKIIEQGYRVIFERNARAYDQVAQKPREEHSRKTRTLAGNFQMFTMFPHLFNPLRSPIAIQFFSHKFLRVLVPYCMAGLFLANLFLIFVPFYRIIFLLQILFYGMALTGMLSKKPKYGMLKPLVSLCALPYVFCFLNYSAVVGLLKFSGAGQAVMWEKARTSAAVKGTRLLRFYRKFRRVTRKAFGFLPKKKRKNVAKIR